MARAATIPPPTTKQESMRSLTWLGLIARSNLYARVEPAQIRADRAR